MINYNKFAIIQMGSNGKQSQSVTLAVLPFENLTKGNDMDIICQSFSIDLTTELSRFKQFQIIAPDSLEQINPDEGEEINSLGLDIDYHIKGSFRADKSIVRINAQLVSSKNRHLVWADRFEGTTEQILDLQSNLLKQVVSGLQQQLNYNLLTQIREKPKVNLKAYESWLYGMQEIKKGTLESDIKAREYFQHALDEEPHFSLAHTGMSLTYFNEWSCQLWERWDYSMGEAFEWANRAIELDEQNYVASLVLGRVLLFEHAFETAEHYLRKSIMLNPNDADNLNEIASCITFLGYAEEAWELHSKAVNLNPAGRQSYYPAGAFILLELGRYEEAQQLVQKTHKLPWVDTAAYFSAIYYHLGDVERSEKYWNKFLQIFSKKIKDGEACDPLEAIEWMIKVNPHKGSSNLEPFWKFRSEGGFVDNLLEYKTPGETSSQPNSFLKQFDFWQLSYHGVGVQLAEIKGFYDLRKLLSHQGQPIHCAELMGARVNTNQQPIIDEKARAEYQSKILELQQDISSAEQDNDLGKLNNLQNEYDHLIEHLSATLGLKGKIRQAGNPIEKARSAVTWRIRNSISKIEKAHPALGKHLSNAVSTGTFCTYDPENKMDWILD